jgi:hypothetical protein
MGESKSLAAVSNSSRFKKFGIEDGMAKRVQGGV